MLIVFGGLPGTGKTTLAKTLARAYQAVYLRIDSIEQAIRSSGSLKSGDIGPAGYLAAYRTAEDNLLLGRKVVADCVNPLRITREAWAQAARNASVPLLEIEVVCSNPVEHRQRVESRKADIAGHTVPTWKEVVSLHLEAWDTPHFVLDTAGKSIGTAESEMLESIAAAMHSAM